MNEAWTIYTERRTWDLRSVRPQRDVELEAQREGRKVHYGMAY